MKHDYRYNAIYHGEGTTRYRCMHCGKECILLNIDRIDRSEDCPATSELADWYARHPKSVDVPPARLDPNGDSKPLTKLVKHERAGECVNGMASANKALELREEGKPTIQVNGNLCNVLGYTGKSSLRSSVPLEQESLGEKLERKTLSQEQTDALESLRLARMALKPAIRHRNHLMNVKPHSASNGYTQVCRIEALLDDLIETMEKG